PDFGVLFLPRKLVILPEGIPAAGAVVALRRSIALEGRAFDELARGFIEDDAGRAEVVAELEEDVHLRDARVDLARAGAGAYFGDFARSLVSEASQPHSICEQVRNDSKDARLVVGGAAASVRVRRPEL